MADRKNVLTRVAERLAGSSIKLRDEQIRQLDRGYDFLKERFAELELALEDTGFVRLTGDSAKEFSREGLKKINYLARIFFFKNPLIKRAVLTQTTYVFGQGVEISAEQDDVNEVIQDFIDNEKNKAELTDHQTKQIKETELQLFANLYFVFFINRINGAVTIRTIPESEIEDIICDPDDSKSPWYYRRVWNKKYFDFAKGKYEYTTETMYYPDWKLPKEKRVKTIGGKTVSTDAIYHVKVNALSDMKFGVSEVYAALDWAKAYKNFMEDWATVTNSLAKFAWNYKAKGSTNIKKIKDKLNMKLTGEVDSSVYPPTAGSVNISPEDMRPIKTAGAQVSMKDGQQMIHMVSAATGIFYHYLAGDPSTGNLATAKAMERPMEIMFRDRQELWKSIYRQILYLVIKESVRAPEGKLHSLGSIKKDDSGQEYIEMYDDKKNKNKDLQNKPISLNIDIDFPELLEKDVKDLMESIKAASEVLKDKGDTIVTERIIVKEILNALQVSDVDDILERLFSDEVVDTKDGAIGADAVSIYEGTKKLKKVFENAIKKESKAIAKGKKKTR